MTSAINQSPGDMSPGTPGLAPGSRRVASIDVVRGLVMIFMALDHTRDFFSNLSFDLENLTKTGYALFFTRWITHFSAPLFFFLAGTGAFFYGARHTPAELRRFLWTRGLWLAILEFTVVGTAWTFVVPWGFFGVIWSLGLCMIILSLVVRLPLKWIVGLSVAVIALHDLLDPLRPAAFHAWGWLWSILHVKGGVSVFGLKEFVLFPLVPWCAVMALGYAFGALFQRTHRRVRMTRIGLAMVAAFVVLRLTNLYGNPPAFPGGVTPGDWHIQPTFEKTLILFLDTEKYPPSLQFLLMTLGPALLLLGWLDGRRISRLWEPILTFGRVPMFFYVMHLFLIHALAICVAALFGQPYRWLLHGGFWFFDLPDGYGHNIPFVYLVWAVVIVLLYFPCRWFARLKQRRREWWLSYV